jgi:hypothetical protein
MVGERGTSVALIWDPRTRTSVGLQGIIVPTKMAGDDAQFSRTSSEEGQRRYGLLSPAFSLSFKEYMLF